MASNLTIDELRRRARRRHQPLDDGLIAASAMAPDDSLAAREALERIGPRDRLLLLRFRGGLTHREIAALLDISEPAARQRLSRARRAFADAFRATPLEGPPRVYVLVGDDEPAPYMEWLRDAGADARPLPRHGFGAPVHGRRAACDLGSGPQSGRLQGLSR